MDRTVVAWTMFIVLTLGLINLAPNEFIEGTSFNPRQIEIPDQFDAWAVIPDHISLNHNLTKGSYTEYDFKAAYNLSIRIRVSFNRFLDGRMKLFSAKPDQIFAGASQIPFVPVLTKNELAAHWNPDTNVSTIEYTNVIGKITGFYYDANTSRNDLISAWENDEINCTITVPTEWESDDDLGAREIVLALLTFNLDSVFRDIDPTLGFFMSATIFVPILFVFFTVIMWGIHGE